MNIVRKSPLTGKTNIMDLDITERQLSDFQHGMLVQLAFPQLTNEEREFILTGYTPEDWSKMFPPGDED